MNLSEETAIKDAALKNFDLQCKELASLARAVFGDGAVEMLVEAFISTVSEQEYGDLLNELRIYVALGGTKPTQ